MHDAKIAVGTVATAVAASAPTWLETAQSVAGLVITVVVGTLSAWYTWERIKKIRRDK